MYESNRGFIAIMSAVIISAVLIVVVISGGLTGFFSRANILDAELKRRSVAVAEACVDQALVLVTNDPTYSALSALTFNDLDSCRVAVSGTAPSKLFRVQATSTPAVTNLEVTYNTDTRVFGGFTEEATF